MRSKAVVLQVDGDSAVVLKEGGEFLRVPLRGRRWRVGQEVFLQEAPRRSRWRLPVAWAAAAALLVAVVAGGLVMPVSAATSYITVDTGAGSVGLVAGERGDVIQAVVLEGDGELAEEAAALEGLPLDRAIAEVLDRAATQGPAGGSGTVLIGAAPLRAGEGLPPAVRQAVERAQEMAATALQQRNQAGRPSVMVIAVDDPEVGPVLGRVARERHLSVAQSALWAASQVAGAPQPDGAAVGRALDRLAKLTRDELRRSGQPEALVAGVLKSWLGDGDLAGLARVSGAGAAGGGEERARDGTDKLPGRAGRAGETGGRGPGVGRRDQPVRGAGQGGAQVRHGGTGAAPERGRGGTRGDQDQRHGGAKGVGAGSKASFRASPAEPRRQAGRDADDRRAGRDEVVDRDGPAGERPGARQADGSRGGGNGKGGPVRRGLIQCPKDAGEADGPRGDGGARGGKDRSDLPGFVRDVLESILCRER
ncbi:MAG TPA: anti-sigma factor domain-containing protein [Thermaerobacter sp.]